MQITDGIYELVQKHNPRRYTFMMDVYAHFNCFLCDFGMPADTNASRHSFWEELWQYLEHRGIDSVKFRQELLASARMCAKSAYDACSPFMREVIMRKVRWAA